MQRKQNRCWKTFFILCAFFFALAGCKKEKLYSQKDDLLLFEAEWCIYCKALKQAMNEPVLSKVIQDNFNLKEIDVDTPLGEAMTKRYHPTGMPYFAIARKKDDSVIPILLEAKGNKYDASKIATKLSLAIEGKDPLSVLLKDWTKKKSAMVAMNIASEYAARLDEFNSKKWFLRTFEMDTSPKKETGVWALYNMAVRLYKLGLENNQEALVYFERIIIEFPESQAAKLSQKERIKILNKS